MTKFKLLAFDLDGTLMDDRKCFPEINVRALRKCEAAGMRLAFVSGRSFEVMRAFAKDLGVRPVFAAANGARIEESVNGPTLYENHFPRETAEKTYDVLEESGMYFNVYTRGKLWMGNSHVLPSLGPRYAHHVTGVTGEAPYLYETADDRARLFKEGLDGVYKFVVMGAPYDEGFERVRRQLEPLRLCSFSSSRRNIEFMPEGQDKGSAIRFLCGHYGIGKEECAAFGDQTNDISMLSSVGFPVAMENAVESVKAGAKLIAPSNNEGGVGQVLEKILNGEL